MHTVITFMTKRLQSGCVKRHGFRYPLYTSTLASSIWFFWFLFVFFFPLKFVSPKLKDVVQISVRTRKQKIKVRENAFSKAKEDLRAEGGEGTK